MNVDEAKKLFDYVDKVNSLIDDPKVTVEVPGYDNPEWFAEDEPEYAVWVVDRNWGDIQEIGTEWFFAKVLGKVSARAFIKRYCS